MIYPPKTSETPYINLSSKSLPTTIKPVFHENTATAHALHRPQKGNEGRGLAHPSPSQTFANSPKQHLLELTHLEIGGAHDLVGECDNNLAAILSTDLGTSLAAGVNVTPETYRPHVLGSVGRT